MGMNKLSKPQINSNSTKVKIMEIQSKFNISILFENKNKIIKVVKKNIKEPRYDFLEKGIFLLAQSFPKIAAKESDKPKTSIPVIKTSFCWGSHRWAKTPRDIGINHTPILILFTENTDWKKDKNLLINIPKNNIMDEIIISLWFRKSGLSVKIIPIKI